jgi:hypothetical protein
MATASIEPPYASPPVRGREGSASSPPIEVHRANDAVITRVDKIDFCFERGGKTFKYVYRFGDYEVRVGDRVLTARRYADTWDEVAIHGDANTRTGAPYEDKAFIIAARYFLGLDDVRRVTALVQGEYRLVDPADTA